MSATERLRAMLDERGEYYETSGNRTWWGRPIDARTGEPINVFHNQAQPMGEDRLFVELQLATPEQAIEATLGRGECKLVHTRDKPRSKALTLTCSECGWWTDRINDEWRYCPRCGKRVKA